MGTVFRFPLAVILLVVLCISISGQGALSQIAQTVAVAGIWKNLNHTSPPLRGVEPDRHALSPDRSLEFSDRDPRSGDQKPRWGDWNRLGQGAFLPLDGNPTRLALQRGDLPALGRVLDESTGGGVCDRVPPTLERQSSIQSARKALETGLFCIPSPRSLQEKLILFSE